jgi:hypothetical protein
MTKSQTLLHIATGNKEAFQVKLGNDLYAAKLLWGERVLMFALTGKAIGCYIATSRIHLIQAILTAAYNTLSQQR